MQKNLWSLLLMQMHYEACMCNNMFPKLSNLFVDSLVVLLFHFHSSEDKLSNKLE